MNTNITLKTLLAAHEAQSKFRGRVEIDRRTFRVWNHVTGDTLQRGCRDHAARYISDNYGFAPVEICFIDESQS